MQTVTIVKIKRKLNEEMKRQFLRLRQSVYFVVATAIAAVTFVPALQQMVSAFTGGQVTSRFIQLSDSTPNAASATYNVSFKPSVTSNIGGIVVDFCADSPIVGNTTCTYPTAFTLGTTVTVAGLSGFSTSTGTWVTTNSLQCGAAASNFQVLLYTNATPQTPTGTGTAINFQITGVHNPSTTGSFYARILTFDTDAHTTAQYTCGTATTRPATFTNGIDYGGIALSTATAISITAKVQETLTFCTSASNPSGWTTTGNCDDPAVTAPTITIGHSVGSVTILDNTAVDFQHAYTMTSTNAQSGAVVRMKDTVSGAACGGLSNDSGATCGIPAAGSSAVAFTAGTAKFGMCVTAGSANTTAASPYNNGGCTQYGFDESTSNNNVLSTYGSQIFSSAGAISKESDDLKFAATAATTTKAGIYTGTYSLIATGTY